MDVKTIISNATWFISKIISKICRPECGISDEDVQDIRSRIKNGDCLVTRVDYELSNVVEKLLAGSYWNHAAIYLDGYMYEAVTGGVRKISFERFCYMKDGIGLCRLQGPDWTTPQIDTITKFCANQFGEGYDYSFDWSTSAKWYCSKYVFMAWEAGGATNLEAIHSINTLGLRKVIPQNLWDSTIQLKRYGVALLSNESQE
jgi:uncharacterized protein YycO